MKELLEQVRDEFKSAKVLKERTLHETYTGLCGAAQQLYLNGDINGTMYDCVINKIKTFAKTKKRFWTYDLDRTTNNEQFIWKPKARPFRLRWINNEISKL